MLKNKIKASLIHLLLSIVLVSLILALVVYFLYPIDYLGFTNFKDITLLIILVDLVLGPILTFVVFNKNKKKLHFDLSVIVMVQLLALTYGVNSLYQVHPLFLTYNHGAFNFIHANEVTLEKAKYDQFKISKFSSVKLAYAKMPDDPNKQTEIMIAVDLKGEPDIDKRVEYYEPYKNHLNEILRNSLDASKLFEEKNLTDASRDFLEEHVSSKNKFAYFALKGTTKDAILVLNKETAEPVTTIDIVPWKYVKK